MICVQIALALSVLGTVGAGVILSGRPRVHHTPCLESRSAARTAPCTAGHGVGSHAEAVALVIECSMPVV